MDGSIQGCVQETASQDSGSGVQQPKKSELGKSLESFANLVTEKPAGLPLGQTNHAGDVDKNKHRKKGEKVASGTQKLTQASTPPPESERVMLSPQPTTSAQMTQKREWPSSDKHEGASMPKVAVLQTSERAMFWPSR